MAERDRDRAGADLPRALADLGRHIAYPPTPDLAARVRTQLEAVLIPHRRPWQTRRRHIAMALAAVLVALVVALVLSSAVRATISRWLVVPGVIFVTHSPVPTPTPHPVGTSLALGQRVTLAEVRRVAPFRVLLPTAPGFRTPDEIYFGTPPPSGQVAFVYRARPGLPRASSTGVGMLLTEFLGNLIPEGQFFFKGIESGTRVERVTMNGQPGYWLSGKAHLFFYGNANGTQFENIRLAGNTLLWQRGALTLRLESALGKDQALRVARSVR